MRRLTLQPVEGLPEIQPGADLAALIVRHAGAALREPGTVVCVVQKLISKAEGCVRSLSEVQPSPAATAWAERFDGDARHIQVVLEESAEVLRAERGVLICRTHHGFVCANAGVDRSNTTRPDEVICLPTDPDRSARELRAALQPHAGPTPLAVLISDSFGRAWRHGQADIAIGLAGLMPLTDHEGAPDRAGRVLQATLPAFADELASAADLVRTKSGGEGVVLASGLELEIMRENGPGAAALLRSRQEDLFGARENPFSPG